MCLPILSLASVQQGLETTVIKIGGSNFKLQEEILCVDRSGPLEKE